MILAFNSYFWIFTNLEKIHRNERWEQKQLPSFWLSLWIFFILVKIHKLISFIESNCDTRFYPIFLDFYQIGKNPSNWCQKGNYPITNWIQDYVFWFMLLTLHSSQLFDTKNTVNNLFMAVTMFCWYMRCVPGFLRFWKKSQLFGSKTLSTIYVWH